MGVSERNSVHMAKKQADYGNESITMLKGADKVRKLYNGMIPCYLYQYFKSAPASRSDPR